MSQLTEDQGAWTPRPEFESTRRRLCLGTSSTWLLHLPGFETAGILSLSLSEQVCCVCVLFLFKKKLLVMLSDVE